MEANNIISADHMLFSLNNILSVKRNTIPQNPNNTPIDFNKFIFSFFIKGEKINLLKSIGVLLGFCGIIFLFTDRILFNENNIWSALIILLASTFYVVGGVLTLKISNKSNENVTASILIWATIFLLPLFIIFEQPWNLAPRLDSTISLIYLGIFATGIAWLLRFYILKNNGLVFQAQVAYLIPIFGVILGYLILN